MKKKYSLSLGYFVALAFIALPTEGKSEITPENPAAEQTIPKIFSPKGTALGNPLKELRRMGEETSQYQSTFEADPITGAFTPPYQEPSNFGENVAEAWETTKKKLQEFFARTPQKTEDKDNLEKPMATP